MTMLRDVRESDLPIFFEHQRDPAALAMAAFVPREWDAFVAHWRTKILAVGSNCKKTIEIGEDVVGNVLSWDQDGKRLVGYWIGRAHWGRGIATAALTEFLEHDRERPLYAYVAARNPRSLRVLEKCGFRAVGEAETDADGVEEWLYRLASANLELPGSP